MNIEDFKKLKTGDKCVIVRDEDGNKILHNLYVVIFDRFTFNGSYFKYRGELVYFTIDDIELLSTTIRKLKPCPFCGCESTKDYEDIHAIYCQGCPCGLEDNRKTLDELKDIWGYVYNLK